MTISAYLVKNRGKEHLYTTTYTYQGTGNGYPAGDAAMVCPLITEESYAGANTKNKLVSAVAANGIDYASISDKVRQFTGMTAPLTLTVTEAAEDTKAEDTFTYAGKTYQLTVSGKKKTDDIRETKYEYDGKNQLVAFTDPEGRRETYT